MSVLYGVLRKSRLLVSVGVVIILITVIFSAPVIAAPVAGSLTAPKVAIYSGVLWETDVKAKLTSTGLFSQVDEFQTYGYTPTLPELKQYNAVLVYSDAFAFDDSTVWGNILADYMDAGFGVVMATFAFSEPGRMGIAGRISDDGYLPFTQSVQGEGVNLSLVADDSTHPLLSGVSTFDGGARSYHNTVSLTAGATLIAHWSNGYPLVATKETTTGRIVGLNFFPPSSDARDDLWVSTTDGARLMANSLIWTSSTGGTISAPTITSNGGGDMASVDAAENQTTVTTMTAVDPDSTALTYSKSGYDAELFNIDSSTGVLTFAIAPDFESPIDGNYDGIYGVTVQVSDGALTDSQLIWVTVTDVNEAPAITSDGGGDAASIYAVEHQTGVTVVTATDEDGDALAYGIVGGVDSDLFAIDSNGALAFKSAPDLEAPADADADGIYEVTVRVSDGALADTQALSVTVTFAPVDQLIGLRTYIQDLQSGGLVTRSTVNGLIRVIDKAIDKLNARDYAGAIKQLTSLRTTVQRIEPKKITSADSDYIVAQINEVISRLTD